MEGRGWREGRTRAGVSGEGERDPGARRAGGAGPPGSRPPSAPGSRPPHAPWSRPPPLIGRGAEQRLRHWPAALHSVPRPGVRGTGARPGRAAPGEPDRPPAPRAHLEGVDVHRVGERVGDEARHGRGPLLLRSRRRRSWRFRGTHVTGSRVTSRRRVQPRGVNPVGVAA